MSKLIECLKNPPMKTVDIWRCIGGAVDDTKCVMDGGCIQDCNEAIRLQKAGLQKESCSDWRRYTYDNIDYPAWEQSILATLIAEGWVRKDEVLARLPKIGQVDKKSIVLIFGRMFAKGYDAAIEECIAAITQTGGADEANHKS